MASNMANSLKWMLSSTISIAKSLVFVAPVITLLMSRRRLRIWNVSFLTPRLHSMC